MTLETGLIWAIAIMTLGGVGLAGFAIWLRKKPRYPHDDGPLSEAASKRIHQIAQPMLQKGEVLSQRNLDDWLAENQKSIESSNAYVEKHGLPIHSLKGSLKKPETPVSIETMNETIAKRGAGLLKGQLNIAEDFDAPLPDDIQASFEGQGKTFPRTPEEQAWLDMVPVGREFGSKDHDRLMEMDAKSQEDNELCDED